MQYIYTIKKGLEWEKKKKPNSGEFENVEKSVGEITKGKESESNSVDITKEKAEDSSKKMERC